MRYTVFQRRFTAATPAAALLLFAAPLLPAARCAAPPSGRPTPVLDVIKLFDKDIATVRRALGRPISSYSTGDTGFAYYRSPRGPVMVTYRVGRARRFQLILTRPEPDPQKALALVGISVRGLQPAPSNAAFSAYRKAWRGKFAHPAIREAWAAKAPEAKAYSVVVVKDAA
jgi:hypothetical protein